MYNSLNSTSKSQEPRFESNPVDRPSEGTGPASAWQCYYPEALRRQANQLREMRAEIEAEKAPAFREIQRVIRESIADSWTCNKRNEKQYLPEIELAASLSEWLYGVTSTEFLRQAMCGLKDAGAPAGIVNGVASLYFDAIRKNG